MTTETCAPQHDELSGELNALLDGQLDAGRAAQVEQHAAACAVCARDLEELRATRALVRELPRLRAPRTFVVPAPAEPRWQRLLGWGWRLGSAASAACVLVAALSMNRPVPASFSGPESSAAVAKNEAPAPPPQAAQERSALTARDSAASGAAAGAAAPLAPAATQVAPAPSVGTTAAREPAAAPASDAPVPARRSPATPWILAALLLGVVSAYVYTLERKATTA